MRIINKKHCFRCSECGKELESVSLTAFTEVARRHREKDHPNHKGDLHYTPIRLNGKPNPNAQ